MQASLPKELVPLGATNLLTVISTSCAIFTAIGQALFQKRLMVNLSAVLPPDAVDRVIDAGATNIGTVIDPDLLPEVMPRYGKSVTEVFVSRTLVPKAQDKIANKSLVCHCCWSRDIFYLCRLLQVDIH